MPNLQPNRRTVVRTILLISTPLLVSVALSTLLMTRLVVSNLEQQASSYGQSMAEQLAVLSSEFVLANDLLSLNVLLAELVEKDYFLNASIYSADNRLLVTSGVAEGDAQEAFTAEIHYQDSIAGYIRLSLDTSGLNETASSTVAQIVLLNLFLLAGFAWLAYKSRDGLARFLFLEEASSIAAPLAGEAPHEVDTVPPDPDLAQPLPVEVEVAEGEDVDEHVSVLVIRLRPIRLARELEAQIGYTISVYHGEIKSQGDDELTAYFRRGPDHCFQAICAALVIRSLSENRIPGAQFSGGIHFGEEVAMEDLTTFTKQAIYLASLDSGRLLSSENVYNQSGIAERVKITEFHSFLSPESRVFTIESLNEPYQALIHRQAQQLSAEDSSEK